jgi:hypothetical protein
MTAAITDANLTGIVTGSIAAEGLLKTMTAKVLHLTEEAMATMKAGAATSRIATDHAATGLLIMLITEAITIMILTAANKAGVIRMTEAMTATRIPEAMTNITGEITGMNKDEATTAKTIAMRITEETTGSTAIMIIATMTETMALKEDTAAMKDKSADGIQTGIRSLITAKTPGATIRTTAVKITSVTMTTTMLMHVKQSAVHMTVMEQANSGIAEKITATGEILNADT